MSKIRVAINGFGRIGKATAKIILTKMSKTVDLVAINNLSDITANQYGLKFDSTYGRFDYPVEADGEFLIVKREEDQVRIKDFTERDPLKLPWKKMNVDVVLECTGIFRTNG